MQLGRVLNIIEKVGIKPPLSIGILGLAYKPGTNIVDESQSLMLAGILAKLGFDVHVYDPAAMNEAKAILGSLVNYEKSMESYVSRSDACIIATPWRVFRRIDRRLLSGKTLIGCLRLFKDKELPGSTNYIALGRGIEPLITANRHLKPLQGSLK